MSEWLDLMLAEVARKKEEDKAAQEEAARRAESHGKEKPAVSRENT